MTASCLLRQWIKFLRGLRRSRSIMNRRYFMGTTLGAVAALRSGAVAASDQVNIGISGVGGRGRSLIGGFKQAPGTNIKYLCDADQASMEKAMAIVEKLNLPKPQQTNDMRRVLEDKTVDAVVIATPDHGRAPAAILACDAGKDVYVEKPPSHNIREGRLIIDAARRNNRIVQVGTQSRSRPSTIRAMEYVKSGKIG